LILFNNGGWVKVRHVSPVVQIIVKHWLFPSPFSEENSTEQRPQSSENDSDEHESKGCKQRNAY